MNQLSKRYAKALLDGRNSREIEEIQNDLLKFQQIYCQFPQLQHLINGAMISQQRLRNMIIEMAKNLELSQSAIQFIKLLLRNRRLNKLSYFIPYFKKYINSLKNIKVIDITSHYPLDKLELIELNKYMKRITGGRVQLNNKIDSSIIAGLRLEYDGYYFDGTLNQQITNFEQNFRKLSYGL